MDNVPADTGRGSGVTPLQARAQEAHCVPLTRLLVEKALGTRHGMLPDAVRTVARDCLADWLACAFAGLREPVSGIVAAMAREEGGNAQATLLGLSRRGTVSQAALVNGTLAHALDYDDVNLAVPGHLSSAILPALLALAEHRGCTPTAVIAAFVAGYELACAVGVLVEPAHYNNGFHATATLGCLGAAVACAHVLALRTDQACHAVSLAATQAAGLKAMFGSMAKPLHAGLAAQAGLRAALLAEKGCVGRPDILECEQGFARVHGGDFHAAHALAPPSGGFHVLNNLFKYHAACYSTHSTIEAIAALRRGAHIAPDAVVRIEVVAGEGCSVCNVQDPRTATEARFSIRAAAAFAMLGIDTGSLDSWVRVTDPAVAAMLGRVRVQLVPELGLSEATVTLTLDDGRRLTQACDSGVPIADKAAQSARVSAKFRALSRQALGEVRAVRILSVLATFEDQADVLALMRLCGDR